MEVRYYFIENHCYGMRIVLRKFDTPAKKPVREEGKQGKCSIMGPSDASQTSQTDMSKLSLIHPALLPSPTTHKCIPKGTVFLRSVIMLLVTELPSQKPKNQFQLFPPPHPMHQSFRLQTSLFPFLCFSTATSLKTPQILSFFPLLFFGCGTVYVK